MSSLRIIDCEAKLDLEPKDCGALLKNDTSGINAEVRDYMQVHLIVESINSS